MTVATDVSGITHGWAAAESGWGDSMNANLRIISRIGIHLASDSGVVNAPPNTPSVGTRVIIGTAPTGEFVGKAGNVAYYDGTAWEFFAPKYGWRAWIGGSEMVFDGSAWVAVTSGGGSSTPVRPSVIAVSADREFAATDAGNYLSADHATGIALTLPVAGFVEGDIISGVQRNSGQVSITTASGVTLNVPEGHNAKTRGKFSAFSLILTPQGWDLTGDLEVAP